MALLRYFNEGFGLTKESYNFKTELYILLEPAPYLISVISSAKAWNESKVCDYCCVFAGLFISAEVFPSLLR